MTDGVSRVSLEIGGTSIEFETGKYAKQASGSVVVSAGDTKVLCTATAGNQRDVDFLPLTVDVEERMYAAGKIPGSFFRREGRAGEKATLTARMIDRPLRPLFPKGWTRETQLVSIPMSVDHENPYDILAMNGASAALMVSDIPFPVPVGAVRIGQDAEGNFLVNPDEEWLLESPLDLVVAGTEEAILMVEAGANEITEAEILDALDIAHQAIKELCQAQRDLQKQAGKPKVESTPPQVDESILSEIKERFGAALDQATQVTDKLERQEATKRVEEEILEALSGDPNEPEAYSKRRAAVQLAFDKLEKDVIRKRIAVDKKRPDGRAAEEIRDIWIEVGMAPRTHGSAIFTRGQTQAFSVAALGTTRDEMRLDTLGLQETKHYFHHYNFPPFSVGEAGFMRGPKRRDIGHGALAERALVPVVPGVDEFPYTIRVVSDILESNGSSSMASVCGSSLSLMDAGVPLKSAVAGVAMGLIKEGDDYIVLTDIAGVEDHLGDMDFKVAGTSEGITALQMDIKITGVTFDILRDALAQAQTARLSILGKMKDAISEPREELSQYAPRISAIQIDTEKIGAVIGKGGETIRALSEEFDAQIDIDDDGTIRIYAQTGDQGDALVDRIRSMTKEVEVGDEFTGKVVKTTTFGAFVELAKGTDGLLHISNISPGERVGRGGGRNQPRRRARRSRWSRSTASAAGSGCASPRTPRSPASRPRSSPPWVPATRARGGGQGRPRRRRAAATRRPRERTATATASAGRATGTRRSSGVERQPHKLTALDSGVRVVTEAMPSVRSIALGFWIRTGSRDEGTEQAGISHFLEHLLFKGTERFSSREIDEAFDAMGAEVNAGTGKETTSVYSRFLDRHLERAFDVLQDMVLRPAYPDIDSERQVVIEEIAMYEDEPSDKVHDVLAGAIFGDHPLGRPIIGSAEVISSVPVPEIAAWHDGRYNRREHRGRGGGQHRPRTARGAGFGLGRACAATVRRPWPARRPTAWTPALRFHEKETEQYHLCLGGPGIPRGDERRFALRVLDTILGGSTSSRLFQEIREKRGLAYAVYSYASHYVDSGQVGALRGHAARQRGGGHGRDRDRAAAPAGGRRDRRRSSSGRGRTSRGARCSRWSRRSRA